MPFLSPPIPVASPKETTDFILMCFLLTFSNAFIYINTLKGVYIFF